jgi:prevent-host-death family protein
MVQKDTIIALKEFRLNAQKYIDASSRGHSFIVVKRSRPVFRIEPMEEQWETIADFSALPGGGISAKKLLAALRK